MVSVNQNTKRRWIHLWFHNQSINTDSVNALSIVAYIKLLKGHKEQCPTLAGSRWLNVKEHLLCARDHAHSQMIPFTETGNLELQFEFMRSERSGIQTKKLKLQCITLLHPKSFYQGFCNLQTTKYINMKRLTWAPKIKPNSGVQN